jgi:outer membrane protein
LSIAAAALGAHPLVAQTAAPIKIGVVNQDKVLNESEEGRRLKAELEKLRNSKQATIEAKEKEIKGIQDQLTNAQLSLSEDKRDEIARQLKRKRVEYERLNDDATAEFQDAANRAQSRLIGMFHDMIMKYGPEKGYTVILEKNTLYYAAGAVDITDELLARFNAATQPAAASPPPKP